MFGDWIELGLVLVPVAAAACLYLYLYLVKPLRIRAMRTKRVRADYVAVDASEVPEEVAEAFEIGWQQLSELGFRSVGTLRREVAVPPQASYMTVYVHDSLREIAQVIGVITQSKVAAYRVVTVVGFVTEYVDGTWIETSNSKSASVFPPNRRGKAIRCPGIWDLELLHRFHRARVERDGGGRMATLDRAKSALARVEWEHRETFERLIRAGYFKMDAAGENYVRTVKGAYLMAYRLLPPWKQINMRMGARRAEKELRQLGFGGMEAFVRAQRRAGPMTEEQRVNAMFY
jgi:hypothetical protein